MSWTGDLSGWHKRLKAKHDACELTQGQATLLCLLDIRNNLIHHSKALDALNQHVGLVTGVAGGLDGLMQDQYGEAYTRRRDATVGEAADANLSTLPVPRAGTDTALSEGSEHAV